MWWAVARVHPYVIPGTDTEVNACEDRRVAFGGPESLGELLAKALIADPAARLELSELQDGLSSLSMSLAEV